MVARVLPLTVDQAAVIRRGRRLLGPVSLRLEGAGLTVVIGPNGAGKTTLLRLLHGLERPSRGDLAWAVPPSEARRGQAFVFQSPVVMRRSVIDCIAYPLSLDGISRARARARAHDWANRVGLGAFVDRPAELLSRGEKQKLALARALIRGPQVLFLDEPSASLDGPATRDIEAILAQVRAEGTRIVMATHDMGQARRLADEVIFLRDGTIHDQGAAPAFFTAPPSPAAAAFLRGDILT